MLTYGCAAAVEIALREGTYADVCRRIRHHTSVCECAEAVDITLRKERITFKSTLWGRGSGGSQSGGGGRSQWCGSVDSCITVDALRLLR
jgi:hypothetical protein